MMMMMMMLMMMLMMMMLMIRLSLGAAPPRQPERRHGATSCTIPQWTSRLSRMQAAHPGHVSARCRSSNTHAARCRVTVRAWMRGDR
jgi:hypothetical protein